MKKQAPLIGIVYYKVLNFAKYLTAQQIREETFLNYPFGRKAFYQSSPY